MSQALDKLTDKITNSFRELMEREFEPADIVLWSLTKVRNKYITPLLGTSEAESIYVRHENRAWVLQFDIDVQISQFHLDGDDITWATHVVFHSRGGKSDTILECAPEWQISELEEWFLEEMPAYLLSMDKVVEVAEIFREYR